MLIKREWATPIVMGAFTLSAVTGVAMFFGFKTQTSFTIHEWLGLTFVVGGLTHITVNFAAYKRYLKQPLALTIVLIYVALTVAAFLPLAPKRPANNPLTKMLNALQQASLIELAPVFEQSPQVLVDRLRAAGFQIESAGQSITDFAGADEQRMRALSVIVGNREGTQPAGAVAPRPPGTPPP